VSPTLLIVLLLAACTPSDTSDPQLRAAAFVLDQWKLALSVFGFLGTVSALLFGITQYRRAETWKRAEFLAKEMKEFFANDRTRMALMLSDWSSRQVHLLALTNPDDVTVTRFTRAMQVNALRPHSIVDPTLGSDSEGPVSDGEPPELSRFTREEAVIRDCFDSYLDGLERFGSYLSTGLVTVEDLRPYLGYWIDDLVSAALDSEDAAWAASVITYLHFYGYKGVNNLFLVFGYDIGPKSTIYQGFTKLMADQSLADRLRASVSPKEDTGTPRPCTASHSRA
jgi:hypothetical protein